MTDIIRFKGPQAGQRGTVSGPGIELGIELVPMLQSPHSTKHEARLAIRRSISRSPKIMVKSKETAKHVFLSVHDFLDVGTAPRKVDCIFVFAGRPERKEYALQLYWKGWATRIIISVDRFEWRRFLHLDGVDCAELLRLVHTTTPTKRHFFIQLDTTGAKAFLIPKRKFGTLSEAMALSEFAERLRIKSLMIVSSSFHLRRAMNVVGNCCANVDLELIPVAVPFELSSETRENWWKTSKGFTLILSEYLKNFVYTFFAIPAHSFCRKKVEPRVGTI